MARYWRRLSLIVCSFWMGRAFQRAETIGQPLNYLIHNALQKCPVEKSSDRRVALFSYQPYRNPTGLLVDAFPHGLVASIAFRRMPRVRNFCATDHCPFDIVSLHAMR